MKACLVCGGQLPRVNGRGKAVSYCSEAHRALAQEQRKAKRQLALCSAPGCSNEANRVGAGLCEAHYMRVRRRGTVASAFESSPEKTKQSAGYVLVKAKGHPRSLGLQRAYEHRVVFTDVFGEGPFKCNWCSKKVTWSDMHVDHLDDDKENNHPDNLVASCQVCNQKRGRGKLRVLWRDKHGIEHDGVRLTPSEWAARLGISRASLLWRLQHWPKDKALSASRGKFGPKPGA